MKKILCKMMAIAAVTLSFTALTSCEDVPAPYEIPGQGGDDTPGENSLPYNDDNLSDWTPVTVKGAAWSLGSSYAKATGYNGSGYDETEAWLVSPEITLPQVSGAVINFDHVIRYVFNDADLANHEMYISSDYTGDVKTATWTKLGYTPVASATNTWDFYAANTIAVPQEYLGKKVVVAFKFVCSTSNSTTWEVKNFSITEGTGGDQPSTPTGDALNISGTTVTLTNTAAEAGTESVSIDCSTLGYENAQDAGTVKFSDGTTLTFDGNGETNTPKYYEKTGGFRVYKNNKMIFAGVKKIARIIMTCDAYNGIDYVGNATATVEVSGNNLVYTNLYTEAQGGGVQLRVQTIKIIYAK